MSLIPNEADAAFADQAEPDSVDFGVLLAGIRRRGVVSGCGVTAAGGMNVTVAAGEIEYDGLRVPVVAGNLAVGAAHPTSPRFDLVVVTNAAVKSVAAGVAAAQPVLPAIPANAVVLAAVYVPPATTAVAANQITDKRAMVLEDLVGSRFGEPVSAPATAIRGLPGWAGHRWNAGFSVNAGEEQFLPFFVARRRTFTGMGVHVTTAGAVGSTGRLGAYRLADSGIGPGALVVDCGTVTLTTTGGREVASAFTLGPGIYFACFVPSATVTCACPGAASSPTALPMFVTTLYQSMTSDPLFVAVATGRVTDVTLGLPAPAPATTYPYGGFSRAFPYLLW